WGSMFVAVGLFMALGRFALDAWLRARTSYAVTDKRILIARAGPFSHFTSLDLDRLPDVNLDGAGRARGTIRFGQPAFSNRSLSGWAPSPDPTPQFLAIEDASRVFDLIMNASRKARMTVPSGGG